MGVRVRSKREKDVLAELLRWLSLKGVFCWRNNSGAGTLRSGHFVRFGAPGSADILGLLSPSGRFLAVEVKRPGGRPTERQGAWLEAVRAAGGVAVCASSIEELEAGLNRFGVKL
jgi:hypothetical protein